MAKPTTGRFEPVPEPDSEPDPEQMAEATLMTSVFTGICFMAATVVFASFGALGLHVGDGLGGVTAAKVGLAVGLAVAAALIWWGLRRYADRIRARSANLYRGAWIGSTLSLGIIVVMAYLPWIAFPQYCPPGAPSCV